MKILMATAVACAVWTSATLVAAQDANSKSKEMTYTGCVAPGKDATTFMLTNVMMGDGTQKEKPGETAGKKETPPKMLTLSSTTVKIEPHRGHKVTVMGPTMMEKADTKMMVTALKMVAMTCP
jgi:hypothetical protein